MYKKFIFESCKLDPETGKIVLNYSLDGKLIFQEILFFPKAFWGSVIFKNNAELIDRILFNLHLAGGVSYWKTYCPKEIEIKTGKLNKEQADFWNKLYSEGMSQFYFENQLDPKKNNPIFPFGEFEVNSLNAELKDEYLLPWGGGKDSIVSAEILKKLKKKFILISANDSEVQKKSQEILGAQRIIVERNIASELLALQKTEKVFKGHVPITAYYAFLCSLAAVLGNYKNIVLSNEKSSNYGNLEYKGIVVNHQYSKSFEFEKDIREYLEKFITPDINYFSLLRGWYEIKIVELFSKYDKYFQNFSSCNANFKINKIQGNGLWCGNCPKCAFIFLLLAAFLEKEKTVSIFKKDLFNDSKLEDIFLEILGEKNFKPLECVGTKEESILAMQKIVLKGDFSKSYFVKKYGDKYNKASEDLEKKMMKFYEENFVTKDIKEEIKNL